MKLRFECTIDLDTGKHETVFSDDSAATGDPRRLTADDVPKAIAVVRCVLDAVELDAPQPSRSGHEN